MKVLHAFFEMRVFIAGFGLIDPLWHDRYGTGRVLNPKMPALQILALGFTIQVLNYGARRYHSATVGDIRREFSP